MKTLLKTAILLATMIGQMALAAPLQQDFLITDATLAKNIKKAYGAEMELQPDGSYTFIHLIKVKAGQVYLTKGGWEVTMEPSFMKNVMFTPIDINENDSVFDLMEYMRFQPVTEQHGDVVTRTKKISSVSNGKEYSLTCVESSMVNRPQPQFSQCVLYHGLML